MSGIWLFLNNILYYTWGFIVARFSKGKEIKELIKEKEDLQKKINCLIEYTNKHWVTDNPIKFKNDLLDILQGSDKE